MKKTFITMIAAVVSVMAVTSCGGGAEGPAEEVMSKKAYTQAVAKYDDISDFSSGLARVMIGNYYSGQYGYINKKGKEVTEVKYIIASSTFHDGLAYAYRDGKYGYINTKGKEVIDFKFINAYDFSDGAALVKTEKGYGYINTKGEIISATDYSDAGDDFHEGLTWVYKDGYYGYINNKGEVVIAMTFKDAYNFSEGAALVETKSGYGYINKKGDLITAAEYDDGHDYSDGFAIVYKGDKIHALNNKGQIEFTFPNGILPAEKFHDGMIVVCDTDNMKFGYINKKGEIAIPCKYDAADSFRNGKALTVTVKGYDEDEEEYEAIYSIIDTDGDVVENLTESDAEDYESVDEDFDDMLYVITEGESLRSSLEDLFW